MKNNHDPEKLLELFKKSKKVVSTFVDKFKLKYGRKPHGDDLAKAPEYVRVCIKNCKKIKIHLEKNQCEIPENSSPENSEKKPNPLANVPAKENITSVQPNKSKSKVWGSHLNRSMSDTTNSSTDSKKRSEAKTKITSYSGTLSALVLEDISKNTRKSLTKRRVSSAKKSFLDTMGEDESTLQGLIDDAEVSQMEDPIMRFHPELSMDGLSQHGQEDNKKSREIIDDAECEIGQLEGTQNLKTSNNPGNKNEGKSMSFLTSVKVQTNKVEATDRNFETREEIPISFSGLFSKKRKLESEEENQTNPTDLEDSSSKKAKYCEDYESDEDMFADENVDSTNVVEDELIPLKEVKDVIKHEEEEEAKLDRRKAKNPRKKPTGLVSTNFVKIDLKKKNYVRGSKNMTGAKYKRQEWKKKVNQKFGKRK